MPDLIKQQREEEERKKQQAQTQQEKAAPPSVVKPALKTTSTAASAKTSSGKGADPVFLGYDQSLDAPRKVTRDLAKMDDNQAIGVAQRIATDEQRDDFLTAYRSQYTSKKSANYRPNMPTLAQLRKTVDASVKGGVYSDTKAEYDKQRMAQSAAIASLNSLGVIGIDGSAVNWNTISFEDAVRTVRLIPDETARKAALKGIKAMTEDGGRFARFKTYDLTDSANRYIANTDFDLDAYEEFLDGGSYSKGVRGSFSASGGNSEENRAIYEEYLAQINGSDMTEYQKYWYKRGLDQIYEETTGVKYAPDEEIAQQPEIDTEAVSEAEPENVPAAEEETPKGTEKPSASIWTVLFPKKEKPVQDADVAPAASVGEMPEATPAPTSTPTASGDYEVLGEIAGAGASTETNWLQAMREDRKAAAQEGARPLQPPQEVYGPQIPQAESEEASPDMPYGSINLMNDPVRAAAYVLDGRGNELDQQTHEAVNDLRESSAASRAILGGWHYDVMTLAHDAGEAGQRYQNMGNTGLYGEDDISYVIGGRLGGYYNKTRSDTFPAELTDDVIGMILGVALDAEEAYANNAFSYDPVNETLYDGYLRENPQALANLDGAFRSIYEMQKEKREQDRLIAEASEATKQQQIASAQAAVRSGSYTQDQYDLVVENAPVVSDFDLKRDPSYGMCRGEILGYLNGSYADSESWINREVTEYLRAAGLDDMESAVAFEYRDMLGDYVLDQLTNDLRAAKALGYDGLESYYARQGGFSVERLADRAKLALQEFDAQVDDDTLNTARSYTGGNDGKFEAVVGGVVSGASETSADMLEAVWTLDNGRREDRPLFEQRMRDKYTGLYTVGFASYMYKQDMLAFAEAHPSKEMGQYIKDYIASGADVFRLAIEPEMTWSLEKAAELNATATAVQEWAKENLTQEAGRVFEVSESVGSNAVMQFTAIGAGMLTGSPALGTTIGFGLPTMQKEFETQLAEGKSMKYAHAMGLAKSANMILAEYASTGKLTGRLMEVTGITQMAEAAGGVVSRSKILNATIGFMKEGGGQYVDELLDNFKEGVGWSVIGDFTDAMMTTSDVVKAAIAGIRGAKGAVGEAVSDTIDTAGETFLTMIPNIFLSGVAGVKGAWKKTSQAAQKMAQTGSAEAAREFVESFVEEVQSSENRAVLDEMGEAAAIATETTGIMMTDMEIAPTVDSAMTAQEQAQAHETEAEASRARMTADMQTIQDAQARMDEGEINPDLPAMIAGAAADYGKARQGLNEHTREGTQKREEADRLMGEAYSAAKVKAGQEIEARKESLKERLTMQRYDSLVARRDQLRSRMDEIWSTLDDYSDAADDEAFEQAGAEITAAEEEIAQLDEQIAQAEGSIDPAYIQQRQTARDAADDIAMDADNFVSERYSEASEEDQAAVRSAYIESAQQAAQNAPETAILAAETQESTGVTKEMFDFASRVQRRFGTTIKFVDDIAHGAGGSYENGVITIPKSASRSEVLHRVMTHELTHHAETSGYYRELADALKDIQYGGDSQRMQADLRAIVSTYAPAYQEEGRTFTEADAEHELIAKLNEQIIGGNEEIINRLIEEKPSLARRIYEGIQRIINRLRGNHDPEAEKIRRAGRLFAKALRSVPGNQIGTQYALSIGSHYDYSKPFSEQVDAWIAGRIPRQDTLLIGGTPDVLKKIGFSNLPLTIDQSHMRKILGDPQKSGKPKNDDHDLGIDFIKSLREKISNPVAVIQNRTNSDSSVLVIFADKNKNADNRPIIGAVSVTTGGKINGITIDSTHLSTVHSRGNLLELIEDAVDKQHRGEVGVFYVNKNSLSLLESNQSQVLGTLKGDGLLQSIHDAGSPVKSQYVEQTETKQFERWFNGSKIVNGDGSAKIMYRGGDEDIEIFDRKKSKSSNLYGRGFYFTEEKSQASVYGEVHPYYLSVKHPLSANGKKNITEDQMRSFLEAVAEDEDYGLENYGYGATADSVLRSLRGKDDFSALQDINATAIGDFVAAVELFNQVNGTNYDGIITPTETVVFRSEQIKSADKNVGLFDPQNPNVRYSLPTPELLNQEISAYQTSLANRPVTDEIGPTRDKRNLSERQFATQTVQESQAAPQWLKDYMMTDRDQHYYDRDTNNDQLMRAWGRIQREGYEAVRDRLLAGGEIRDTEDVADANVIMAMAFRDDDVNTALSIARLYNTEGTKAAQGLQARKLFQRMTPLGMQTWAAGQTERQLEEYRRTHKTVDREVKREAKKIADRLKDLRGGSELLRLNAGGDVTVDETNSRWGVPINPQQEELIRQYHLENVSRPGDHYNWATRKQRMLEAILQTPNPLELTGNGLNLIERLEFIKRGQACFTNADLNYIGHWMSVYAHTPMDDQESRIGDIALSRVYEAYGNISEASLGEKAQTWRYASMLLSVPSALRNVVGNATMNVINDAANDVAALLDAAISAATGSERTRALKSIHDRIEGWWGFVEETGNTFRDYFIDKTITQHGSDRFSINQRGRTYQTEAFEAVRRMEGLLMSVGDRNYWRRAYLNSMAEQLRVAELNRTELDFEVARENAELSANYAVFNEDNAVRTALSSLKQNGPPEMRFMLNMIMPFTGVPTNIAARIYQYSPAGLAKTVIQTAADAITGRDFDQQRFVTNLARSGIGTGLLYAGMQLAEAGLFSFDMGTGSEDDDGRYAIETAQGKQYGPYIRVGDQYVQLSILSPAIMPLLMGAAAYDAVSAEGGEESLEALKNGALAAFDTYFSSTFLTGVQDVFGGYGSIGENMLETVVTNAFGQNVPAVIGQLADAMDPYVRSTKDKNYIMRAVKSGIISKIPVLREILLPIKYDITGEPVMSKEAWQAFLDPTTRSSADDDEALQTLLDISVNTGETGFLPSPLLGNNSFKVTTLQDVYKFFGYDRSVSMELTPHQKAEYERMYGDIIFNGTQSNYADAPGMRMYPDGIIGIRELMAGEVRIDIGTKKKPELLSWDEMNDGVKAKAISKIKEQAKRFAQAQVIVWSEEEGADDE